MQTVQEYSLDDTGCHGLAEARKVNEYFDELCRDIASPSPRKACRGNMAMWEQLVLTADSGYESIDGHLPASLSGYVSDDEGDACETPAMGDNALLSRRNGPRTSFNSIREKVGLWEVDEKSVLTLENHIDPISRPGSLLEQKTEHDVPSDGEMSFAGLRSHSSTVTPPSESSTSPRTLALDLADRILRGYAQALGTPCRSHTASTSRSGSSSAGSSTTFSSPSRSTDITTPSKRKLTRIEEDEEDDAEGNTIKKRRRDTDDDAVKLFACPFAKHDPERYSERNVNEKEYRTCSSCLLRDIPRLKQHLYRIHRRPEHYCASCFQAFKTQSLLDTHVRRRDCELKQPLYEEKMTFDQMKAIKRRHRGESSSQNWFSIFKILFPDADPPASPYAGEGDTDAVRHFVHYFRTFGPQNFFDLMRDRQGTILQLTSSTQAIVDEAFEIAAPELMRQMRAERPSDLQYNILAGPGAAALMAANSISDILQGDEEGATDARQDTLESPSSQPQSLVWFDDEQMQSLFITDVSGGIFDHDELFDPLSVDGAFDGYNLSLC